MQFLNTIWVFKFVRHLEFPAPVGRRRLSKSALYCADNQRCEKWSWSWKRHRPVNLEECHKMPIMHSLRLWAPHCQILSWIKCSSKMSLVVSVLSCGRCRLFSNHSLNLTGASHNVDFVFTPLFVGISNLVYKMQICVFGGLGFSIVLWA